jgi:hypothetical protein
MINVIKRGAWWARAVVSAAVWVMGSPNLAGVL